MSKGILFSTLLALVLGGLDLFACDATPINDDSVLVGDRLYSKSDQSFLQASDYMNHTLAVINKEGKETHHLSPLSMTTKNGKVAVEYKLEDLTLKSSTSVSVGKQNGTTCGWKEEKPTTENRLGRDLWKGDVEVLSVRYDKSTRGLVLEVKETCDRGQYDIAFLDAANEQSQEQLYFKVTRTALAPAVCKPDFSETIRITAGLPNEVVKPKTTLVVIGSSGTSGTAIVN